MATTQEFVDALLDSNIAIGVTQKLYIYDKNSYIIDFSDLMEVNGVNRLIEFDAIETVVEKEFNHFYNKTGDISVRNNDGFFNKPFPKTIKSIHGVLATFIEDPFGIINIFRKPGGFTAGGGFDPFNPPKPPPPEGGATPMYAHPSEVNIIEV